MPADVGVCRISNTFVQTNVILEAFGNSRTNRNDNSSRFGKYMDLVFDYKCQPAGGQIQHYLLEKSRVVKQQPGERNFHAFYQLLANGDAARNYGLQLPAERYHYVNQGECCKVERIDDERGYAQVIDALNTVGFTPDEITTVWKIVAAAVHLVDQLVVDFAVVPFVACREI